MAIPFGDMLARDAFRYRRLATVTIRLWLGAQLSRVPCREYPPTSKFPLPLPIDAAEPHHFPPSSHRVSAIATTTLHARFPLVVKFPWLYGFLAPFSTRLRSAWRTFPPALASAKTS